MESLGVPLWVFLKLYGPFHRKNAEKLNSESLGISPKVFLKLYGSFQRGSAGKLYLGSLFVSRTVFLKFMVHPNAEVPKSYI